MFSSFVLLALSGCASVPTAETTESNEVKIVDAPKEGKAGLYIYRNQSFRGALLKKFVYVNGECLGETVPGVYFYKEVEGGTDYTISTESEFSENHLTVKTEAGHNYFINQYIKSGLFVGGANLKLVEDDIAKFKLMNTDLAIEQQCESITL